MKGQIHSIGLVALGAASASCGSRNDAEPRYVAEGHRPVFQLVILPEQIVVTAEGSDARYFPAVAAQVTERGRIWQTHSGRHDLRLETRLGRCTGGRLDGYSYPEHARLVLDGREYPGCGEHR